MKRFTSVFLCLFLSILLSGCFSNPLSKFKSAEAKVASVQERKDKVEEKASDKAVGYNFAAKYSLEKDPEPSKQSAVAKEMLSSSLTITGPPSFKDSLEFKQIVDGLLATNQAAIKAAEKNLAAKNQEVVVLQNQISGLQDKLGVVEKARDKIAADNSSIANKWAKLTKVFWICVWIGVFFFVSHLLSIVLPAPYGSIFGVLNLLLGGIIGLFKSIAPKSLEIAKVVKQESYKLSEETLTDLVKSISEIRKDKDLAAKIDPILLNYTNADDSRLKINEVKAKLKMS